MGDCNAGAYGQVAHLSVLVEAGCLSVADLVCLRQVPPRSSFVAGLMIDDLIFLESIPVGSGPSDTECSQKIQIAHQAYKDSGLPRHEGKSISAQLEGSFWGVQLNGRRNYVRPNLSRAVPLASIILDIVDLGVCSVGLLELLAGSLVSIFQLQRRYMASLSEVYSVQRGRSRSDIVAMTPGLKDELLSCVALIAICKVDFALKPSDFVFATDASMTAEAAVYARVGAAATKEMRRHCLQKGAWNRLLRPFQAYCRERGDEVADEELPDETYSVRPLIGKKLRNACSSASLGRYAEFVGGGASTWARSAQLLTWRRRSVGDGREPTSLTCKTRRSPLLRC